LGYDSGMTSRDILGTTALHVKENYWPLFKSRQTFLLALTGIAGYLCGRPFPMNWFQFMSLVGSLLFTIGGCTSLNMVIDQDIDAVMERTRSRPLPAGQVKPGAASALGGGLIALGLLCALSLSKLYFTLALAGVCLDVLVYTLWLKRRSAWSILWGGLAGGIPILAGRSLALGRVDWAGILLGLAIVCWIPSHNLTLGMLHSEEFLQAGVPVFLNVFGLPATRRAITLSSLFTLAVVTGAFAQLGLSMPVQAVLWLGGLGLLALAIFNWRRSSRRGILTLYKYSSIYLLAVTLLLAFEAFV
jgi:heme o synthase